MLENMGYWQNGLEIEKRYVPLNNAGLIRVNFVEIQNQESRNVKPLVEKYITVECLQKKKIRSDSQKLQIRN